MYKAVKYAGSTATNYKSHISEYNNQTINNYSNNGNSSKIEEDDDKETFVPGVIH
jgi:hypothetical protein